MAEKPEKKPEPAAPPSRKEEAGKAAAASGAVAAASGLIAKTPVLIGAVMILEAVVLFAGFKFLGSGPRNASGADLTDASRKNDAGKLSDDAGQTLVEISLVNAKFPNKVSGRLFLYDVNLSISVKSANQDKVKKMIAERDDLIKDRVRTIIAQSDPEKLGGGSEPGLETLRRQVKYQLNEILGEGMVEEVLVVSCIPYRAEY